MRSIRRQLLSWLLAGIGLLLILLGTGAYFGARGHLLSQIDEELEQAARSGQVRTGARDMSVHRKEVRKRAESRWLEFDYEDGKLFYQIWDNDGDVVSRSASLGDHRLSLPEVSEELPWIGTIEGPGNSRLRVFLTTSTLQKRDALRELRPRELASEKTILVARDLGDLDRTLSLIIGGIWIVGLVAAGGTILLVYLILRRGLSPLRDLGDETAKIDAGSLSGRFKDEGMPDELRPICLRLNDLMARLESSFERERRFGADLAHEIRTPLAEVSAMAEAALLFPDKIDGSRFQEILESARQMEGVLKSLLTLAKQDYGSAENQNEVIQVRELLEGCLRPHFEKIEEKQLNVEIEVSPDEIMEADPELLRHVLNNLISNAVSYTPSGQLIEIGSLANGGLFVKNTVSGLDESDLPHLFERFWRRDRARTDGGHSGLGLSVAKACTEALSMDLSVRLKDDEIIFELISK